MIFFAQEKKPVGFGHGRQRHLLFLFLGLFFFVWPGAAALGAENIENKVTGKESVLFEGKESDDVKIRKGIRVTGTSPSKAVINGDVEMEDGSVLENVTVNGKLNTITVAKGATVTINNVTIKGGKVAGIYSAQGSGTLTIKNSRITKNRKGLYILPGKNLAITANQITDNDEEGIDIRKDTDGLISGNTMARNGEGGGEVIVGSSTLTITGNSFVQNKSSGLALQFYEGNKIGQMTVSKNTFSGNGDHGLVCNSPSGGNRPSGFFRNSVKLLENTFGSNKKGTIKGCGLTNIIPKEGEEDEDEENENEEPQIPFEETASRKKEVALEALGGEIGSVEVQIREPRSLERQWQHFVFGIDAWYFAVHEENLRRLKDKTTALRFQGAAEDNLEINQKNLEKIQRFERTLEELAAILAREKSWAPFGRSSK